MEKIYFEQKERNNAAEANENTIQFLMDYSRSLHFIEHNELNFEISLN